MSGKPEKQKRIDILAISETKLDSRIDDRLIALEDCSPFGKIVVLLSILEMRFGLNPGKIFQISLLN